MSCMENQKEIFYKKEKEYGLEMSTRAKVTDGMNE